MNFISFIKEIVSWKSFSVSPGYPTIKSLENFNLIKFYEFESKVNIDNRFLLNDKRLNSYSKNVGK